MGIYGQPDASLRMNTWDLIRRLYNFDDTPWVIGGDFNEILWDEEKSGGSYRDVRLIQNLCDTLDFCGLKDLNFKGDIFTWCNRRHSDDQVSLRLDRFVANSAFLDIFPECLVSNLDWAKSDHKPIELCLDRFWGQKFIPKAARPFKFEECWSHEDECYQIISRVGQWNIRGSSNQHLHHKLSKCAGALKDRGFKKNKERWANIHLVKDKLKSVYEMPLPIDFTAVHSLERQLDKFLLEEEMYWKQRSRENWLKWGIEIPSGFIIVLPIKENKIPFMVYMTMMGGGIRSLTKFTRSLKLTLRIFLHLNHLPILYLRRF